MRTHDDDKVVYDGDLRSTLRRKRSALAVEEIQRFNTDATTAYRESFEEMARLTPEDQALETAYKKAVHLMHWWDAADKDGDRCIDEKELRSSFPSKDIAKELIEMLDVDGDRLIT